MSDSKHPAAVDLVDAFVKCALVAAITLGFLARALTFQSPLFDLHAWRQADTAAISRNFVNERLNPLYPQVDHRGSRSDGYVETGLELYAFLVAGIARLVGFSTELGRLLNTCLFPVAALLLYRFIAERFGATSGLVGACVYAFGLPLTLFIDRAFMNESLLTLLTIVALRSTQVYLRSRRVWPFVSLTVATTLVAMIKPTFLIVWGPIVGLFVEHYGRRAMMRPELWIVGLVNLAAMTAWFSHAHSLFVMTGLSFGIGDKLFDANLLLSAGYVSKIATRILRDVLGPLGVVFTALGLVHAARRRRLAEIAGVGAFVVYLGVVTVGNFHHNYYQLPVVPIATVLIAVGIVDTVARFGVNRRWSRLQMQVACAVVVWLAATITFARSASFHNWYEIDPAIVYLCSQTRAQLAATDRVSHCREQESRAALLPRPQRVASRSGGGEPGTPRLGRPRGCRHNGDRAIRGTGAPLSRRARPAGDDDRRFRGLSRRFQGAHGAGLHPMTAADSRTRTFH